MSAVALGGLGLGLVGGGRWLVGADAFWRVVDLIGLTG